VPSAGIAGGVRNNNANSYIRARVQFIIYKIVPFTKKVIYFSVEGFFCGRHASKLFHHALTYIKAIVFLPLETHF
jgi:hypothetical protein